MLVSCCFGCRDGFGRLSRRFAQQFAKDPDEFFKIWIVVIDLSIQLTHALSPFC
jgi:hypothetical protein